MSCNTDLTSNICAGFFEDQPCQVLKNEVSDFRMGILYSIINKISFLRHMTRKQRKSFVSGVESGIFLNHFCPN